MTENVSALARETAMRRALGSVEHGLTESYRAELRRAGPSCGDAIKRPVIDSFLVELLPLLDRTSHPYPLTARRIGEELGMDSFAARMIGYGMWPLVQNEFRHAVPAKLLPASLRRVLPAALAGGRGFDVVGEAGRQAIRAANVRERMQMAADLKLLTGGNRSSLLADILDTSVTIHVDGLLDEIGFEGVPDAEKGVIYNWFFGQHLVRLRTQQADALFHFEKELRARDDHSRVGVLFRTDFAPDFTNPSFAFREKMLAQFGSFHTDHPNYLEIDGRVLARGLAAEIEQDLPECGALSVAFLDANHSLDTGQPRCLIAPRAFIDEVRDPWTLLS